MLLKVRSYRLRPGPSLGRLSLTRCAFLKYRLSELDDQVFQRRDFLVLLAQIELHRLDFSRVEIFLLLERPDEILLLRVEVASALSGVAHLALQNVELLAVFLPGSD